MKIKKLKNYWIWQEVLIGNGFINKIFNYFYNIKKLLTNGLFDETVTVCPAGMLTN